LLPPSGPRRYLLQPLGVPDRRYTEHRGRNDGQAGQGQGYRRPTRSPFPAHRGQARPAANPTPASRRSSGKTNPVTKAGIHKTGRRIHIGDISDPPAAGAAAVKSRSSRSDGRSGPGRPEPWSAASSAWPPRRRCPARASAAPPCTAPRRSLAVQLPPYLPRAVFHRRAFSLISHTRMISFFSHSSRTLRAVSSRSLSSPRNKWTAKYPAPRRPAQPRTGPDENQ
jgi:hypothetical protein